MVPKGWKKTHLKCVISGAIKNGYSPLPASTTTGYWVLSLGALTDHGINPLEIKPVVVDEKVKQALLSGGDFLVSRSNTPNKVGRSIRFKNEVQNCSYPDLMMRFCIDTTKADPDFIEIKLKSTEVRQYYKSCAAGSSSSMVKINKAVVENTPLLLPSFPEQKKIAKILSTWDKAISTTEQLLANSQQQKKALMQQLLIGKKRLLDSNGVRFSGDWKQVKLSKIFERVTTKNNGKSSNVVTISGQQGLIRQEDFFKKSVASDILDGYFLLMKGQFAYNKSYSNGYPVGAIKRLNRYADGVVTTLYICFEISEPTTANGDFWEHYFESGLLNKGLSQIAHEGGRAHGLLNVKPTDFFSLKVPLPSLDEQQKIAAVLSTADQEITTLQQKLDALKLEKKALMQQLLTGKRRVKTAEVL